ncbi:hypothetical protein [Azoarcus sp. CIB]|nr:hypothetical protein [Azoarcus sp. CIB]
MTLLIPQEIYLFKRYLARTTSGNCATPSPIQTEKRYIKRDSSFHKAQDT